MPGNPFTDPNWASEVTDRITSLVGAVRDKTTNNAIIAVRAIVFGLLGLILGLFLLTVLWIFLTRVIQSILSNWIDWDTAVYVSYFIIGGLLTIAGAFFMSKRHS